MILAGQLFDSKLSAHNKHFVAIALAELGTLDTTAKRVNAMLDIKRTGILITCKAESMV